MATAAPANQIKQNKSELMMWLNGETAKIAWRELQSFFASGNAVFVDESLDLVDIAAEFALDNKAAFSCWLQAGKVGLVSDRQAEAWFASQATVWAVVVAPWVLVQPVPAAE